jgi:diketogulonate reductase-like aldo/keto reductase
MTSEDVVMQMPPILYGTAWKKSDTARLVALAIRHGFRGIDTACQPKHYNEAGVGQGIGACLGPALTRADLYIQTKFTSVSGQDPSNIPYDRTAALARQVAESFAVSLGNLRTSYLDGLVLHGPLSTMRGTLEVWRAMESLVDQGVVRRLGISNCYQFGQLEALHAAARIKPTVVQNRFYADTGYDREIRAFCRVQNMTYQSFWTLTANSRLLTHQTLSAIASVHGRTSAQILFRYLIDSGVVPLTGTRSESHMREDLAVLEFELTAAELNAIDALL